MPFIYTRLVEITTLPSSTGTLYTHAADTKSYVRCIVLHNSNTTAETAILYKVPDGGSAGATNKILQETMSANDTIIIEYPIPGLIFIDSGELLQGSTTTALFVTIEVTGGQE